MIQIKPPAAPELPLTPDVAALRELLALRRTAALRRLAADDDPVVRAVGVAAGAIVQEIRDGRAA